MTKRERITTRAKEIIASCPEGIRFSELVKRLRESFPGEPQGNLTGNTYDLHVRFPDEIYKPARGLFRLTKFRNDPRPLLPQNTDRMREETMNSLSETLKTVRERIAKYRERIAKYKDTSLSEANTKAQLINPVLRALGWDVEEADEVQLEYKRRPQDDPVDYALLLDGNPRVLVEAKALGQSLAGGKWANKIMGYAGTSGAGWVVVTNGDEYRVYNASVPVRFEERLLRTVRLTDPNSPAEKTLALLSKERIDGLETEWETQWADRRVRAAISTLFSPVPHSRLVSFVRKTVKDMTPRQITASLSRVCTQLSFPESTSPPEPKPPPPKPRGTKEGEYHEFWEPIRTEQDGLFAGKPAGGSWITKSFRRIALSLVVHNHACRVDLQFYGEDRAKRRDKAVKLLPAPKYRYKFHDAQRSAYVRFLVLDKGLKDREHWPEMRGKLKSLGEKIYKALSESDV